MKYSIYWGGRGEKNDSKTILHFMDTLISSMVALEIYLIVVRSRRGHEKKPKEMQMNREGEVHNMWTY